MNIFITGVAGFIGFNFALNQLKIHNTKNFRIYAIDNFDNYYSTKIKKIRVNQLKSYKNFIFKNIDIKNKKKLILFLKSKKIDKVYHFAAQAGVRYSAINPKKYIDVNIKGFINVMDATIKLKPKIIFYASSSSIYGDSKNFPLSETNELNPKNIYAFSKKLNEKYADQLAKFSKTFFIGLRFFTVYGEFGRPDMYIGKLIGKINKKKVFEINNRGNHSRDFTYIGDVCKILDKLSKIKLKSRHTILNICSNNPVNILKISDRILKDYGHTKIKYIKLNSLDVLKTHGDNKKVKKLIGKFKFTNINDGLNKTIYWFKESKFAKYY